ncbi:hypothetical protein Nepgr_025358 [Nepenthes gracilis]|uniref:Uncharacterized protein n=1 Tax=Nepenthes gracilis TaxID=150966 RepID=A0AAD3T5S5_NEPGR|nr:hypothetical protein Nepgr_025358 [Nepenthes gracilis]
MLRIGQHPLRSKLAATYNQVKLEGMMQIVVENYLVQSTGKPSREFEERPSPTSITNLSHQRRFGGAYFHVSPMSQHR